MSALLLFLAFLQAAQDKPPEKCTLSGSVVSAASGEPLNHVEVTAEPMADGFPATTITDAKGNFSLVDLPPGQYKLKGKRNGYLTTYYGARRPESGGIVVALQPGAEVKDVRVKLLAFAVLAGAVREVDGEPLVGAKVDVYSSKFDSFGHRTIRQVDETHTDDLGLYRIANLPPGRYYIRAEPHSDDESRPSITEDHSPKSAPREDLIPALYPGVTDPAAARVVDAAAGARITGLDIPLPRSRVFRVKGRVENPSGPGADITLMPPKGLEALGRTYPAMIIYGNQFVVQGVAPGSYVLSASGAPQFTGLAFVTGAGGQITVTAPDSSGPLMTSTGAFYGSLPVEVTNADVEGLVVTLTQGGEITGHITIEGSEDAKVDGRMVTFDPGTEPGGFASMPIASNGFQLKLLQGRYVVGVDSGQLTVKSIRAGSVDVLREGLAVTGASKIELQIVLANDGGVVDGLALDKDDKPVEGATVVLVPEAGLRRRSDRFYVASTDQNGSYRMENVAPGEYKVFAWDDIEDGAWMQPDFFRDIEARGQSMTLEAKGHQTAKPHLLDK